MKVEIGIAALALGLASPASATAPQSPVAAGPFESVVEVIRAAHACGVHQLRLDTTPGSKLGEARLYRDGETTPAALGCLLRWTTKAGKRLSLKPRWWNDTFDTDTPTIPQDR